MINIEKTDIHGFEAAIRGMRNPKNSWDKSDSGLSLLNPDDAELGYTPEYEYSIGENDFRLMMNLRNAGTDHRKFMRMIVVWCDITAPLYWWKEFDTYKVGTVADSCSTMHKIHAKEFTRDDFSIELNGKDAALLGIKAPFYRFKFSIDETINNLNLARDLYNAAGEEIKRHSKHVITTGATLKELEERQKFFWNQMIQMLPSSYNQKRTVMLNYEVLANIYKARKDHKLKEWHDLCRWIESLPYSQLITGGD